MCAINFFLVTITCINFVALINYGISFIVFLQWWIRTFSLSPVIVFRVVNEPDVDTSVEVAPKPAFAPLLEEEDDEEFQVVSIMVAN